MGGSRFYTVSLLVLFHTAFAAGQNLLAVLDFECDGSVPQKGITAVSDRISQTIAEDSTYVQFQRSQIPELLKQLSIDESASSCSDKQCLTVVGSLIGANYMVGGSIRYKNHETSIEISLIDVAEKKVINSVSFSSGSKKKALFDTEIPALAKSLMNPAMQNPPVAGKKRKKSFLANPFLYIGTGVAGIAAGGACYYAFVYKRSAADGGGGGVNDPDDPSDLSLDDAPARTRGEQ